MSQDTEKSELWWVSVGGNPCEPARVVKSGKTKIVFTIGCNDGTQIESGCGIKLIKKITTDARPETPAETAKREAEWDAKRERDRKLGIRHSYRRFA